MQPKLIITFETLNEPRFLTKSQLIDTSLGTAPATTYFPLPWPAGVPTPAMLHTSFLTYQVAYDASAGGDAAKIVARTAARMALTLILKKIAPYLELVAAGNLTMLEATGYDLRRDITRSKHLAEPSAPARFSVKRGVVSGSLLLKCSKQPGAGSYIVQTCISDPTVEANWADAKISTLCSRIELLGLIPGKIYHLRLCALGTNGRGAWTAPTSIMVV